MTPLESWFWLAEIVALLLIYMAGASWFVSKMFIYFTPPKPRSTHPLHTDEAIRRVLAREFERMS